MQNAKRRAVFLDRDGVINKKAKDHDYIKNWSEFEFLPDVDRVISKLNKDFLVVVVSNQRGVSRGMMKLEDVRDIHDKMCRELKKKNAIIDGIYVCIHGEQENCVCRKPEPGLIFTATKDLSLDLSHSYMIGDSASDIEAGKRAGCKTIFLGQEDTLKKIRPDFIAHSVSDVLNFVN